MNEIAESHIYEYSINNLDRLAKKIETLSKVDHIEIGKIFSKNNIKLTENNNGLFIKLNNIPACVIKEIYNYIEFINKQENVLTIDEVKKNNLENNFFKDIKD
tara:strand:+ start:103 stop:411 length:309 start_codon:yes stop_codon:yes gene_type:complete